MQPQNLQTNNNGASCGSQFHHHHQRQPQNLQTNNNGASCGSQFHHHHQRQPQNLQNKNNNNNGASCGDHFHHHHQDEEDVDHIENTENKNHQLPSDLFIHITFFVNFNDLFKRLRLVCKRFKHIIQQNQLLFIQQKKSLLCMDKKDINLCEQMIKVSRVNRHETRHLLIGYKFIKDVGLNVQVWFKNQMQQQEKDPPLLDLHDSDFSDFGRDVNSTNLLYQVNTNQLTIFNCKLVMQIKKETYRGLFQILCCGKNLKTLKLIEVSYKFIHWTQYDERREIRLYEKLRILNEVNNFALQKKFRNLTQFKFEKSTLGLFYLMLDVINFNTVESLCWDTSNFGCEQLNSSIIEECKLDSQLKNVQEFVFVHCNNGIFPLNYQIIKQNISSIQKLGCHIIQWDAKLTQYLDLIHKCTKLETLQITTACGYNAQVINFIKSILQLIHSSSESRKTSKFGLILGVSFDSSPSEQSNTLETALERNIDLWTRYMGGITSNYCILAQIYHLHSYYDGEKEFMKIYETEKKDYNVYDDYGVKINRPCDISTNWLMVVSKKICQQIIIGDFRVSNNLFFHQQPCANVWFRPSAKQ